MNNSGAGEPNISPSPSWRGIVRWAVKQTVFVLIVAAALFLPIGEAAGQRAWVYLGLVAAVQVLTGLVLIPRSPDLLIERSQLKAGLKAWDIGLAVLMGYSPAFMALAAGLEARAGGVPAGLDAAGFFGVVAALLGTAFTLWAMVANRFFSGIVRIQHERGHAVVSAGPYQYLRHPGYSGMLIFTLATPLILCSVWTFWIAVLTIAVTVLRTSLEDRTLQHELNGYTAYAKHVRHRLIPGVW